MFTRLSPLVAIAILMIGCVSTEQSVREAIKKDPHIVFQVIEDHPEEFLAVVNRSAQKAQQKRLGSQAAEREKSQRADLSNPKRPQLVPERRLIGTEKGRIVVVEYADFQCPACRVAHRNIKEFVANRKGEVQFYFKNMPLEMHEMAYPAARYFEAIRLQSTDKGLKFYDYLFDHQREISTETFLKSAARKVGADMKRLESDLNSERVNAIISEDMKEFEKFGFTGTPSIIINGIAVHGAQPVAELERIADLTLQ